MRSFMKIKSSRIGEITLSFTYIGKSSTCPKVSTSQICVLALSTKINFLRNFPNLQYRCSWAQEEIQTAMLVSLHNCWALTLPPYIVLRTLHFCCSQSKKEGKDQESILSSTTLDPGYQWESDNVTIRHHKREQEVSPFPASEVFLRRDPKNLVFPT